ncbi:MAG: ribonuclease HIII [Candidatus Poribacteria bacterium]|nr:ribonuclease HIII [Candidatus Poribacteria bacterium]
MKTNPTPPSLEHHHWDTWIGTDEAGKGDYFGSLAAAGIYVNSDICERLRALGVRDGKKISDSQIRKLAQEIRMRYGRYVSSVEVTPLRYNTLYASFTENGQNLNHLLAWLHAKAIQNLLQRVDCRYILVDRFAKPEVLAAQLGTVQSQIELVQVPKAESDIAVAAASILARETFLRRLDQLSQRYRIQLPKGASQVIEVGKRFVEAHGAEALRHVAKLHFKTTADVLGAQENCRRQDR